MEAAMKINGPLRMIRFSTLFVRMRIQCSRGKAMYESVSSTPSRTLRHGLAQPLTIAPNTTFAELFVDAARSAEHDAVGLWAACSGR